MKNSIYATLFLLITNFSVHGYELDTHGIMTKKTLDRVLQDDGQLIKRLGLTLLQNDLGVKYYEISGASIYERDRYLFEEEIIKTKLGVIPKSLAGWLMRGAIREDDLGEFLGYDYGPDPHDDPIDPFFRVYHHFFDPVNNLPLNGVLTPDSGGTIHTSAAWALGTTNTNAFTNENTAETTRRNHYSIKDAREYMYRALMGQKADGSTAIVPTNMGVGLAREPIDLTEAELVRKAYWATTFRTLGDAAHLMQDMGQPQHTRNDPHSPSDSYAQTVYEKFINARALGKGFRCFSASLTTLPDLDGIYNSYPTTPTFDRYSDFFSTATGVTPRDITTGMGLADYSNRGFFTAGTNLGNNIYDNPPNDPSQYNQVTLNRTHPCLRSGFKQQMEFQRTVVDKLPGGSEALDVPLTTRGLWNVDGHFSLHTEVRYSLNEGNYNAMADLLIPRAVAYSAGLINYFFRGRFEITPPDEGIYGIVDHAVEHTVVNGVPYNGDGNNTARANVYGFNKIKLKLRNTTADINDGQNINQQTMTNGTLIAIAKYRRNTCYQPDLSGEPVDNVGNTVGGCRLDGFFSQAQELAISPPQAVVNGVVAGYNINSSVPAALSFDFSTTPIPINAWDLTIQIVYRGSMGSEADAVVVATKDIYEPTYFSYVNTSDYVNVKGKYYTPTEIQASTQLTGIVDSYGNNNGVLDEPLDSYERGFINFSFNNSTVNVVNLISLPVQKYFRFAVLTDTYQITLNNSGDLSYNWVASTNQFNSQGLLTTTPINHAGIPSQYLTDFRGTNWRNLIVEDHDYSLELVMDFIAPNLTNLPDPKPIPVTITY